MARIILHIGQSKTGTTAIQHFLSVNREPLRGLGVLYPDIRNRGVFLGATDHNLVAWSLVGKISPIGVPFNAFFENVEKDLRQNAAVHTVILSAEAFLGEPHIWDFDSEDAWRQANRNKIETLSSLLQGHQVTILVYLRRQDYWVNSAFNHLIKIEGLVGKRLYSDIHQFIESLAPRMDYAEELGTWSEHFGRDSIVVRPYERAQLVGGDAVSDFLVQTGLAVHKNRLIHPDRQEVKNPGLPRDVMEVKRILNRVPKSKPEERVLIWALQRIGTNRPSAHPEWDFLLTNTQRKALLERFDAPNRVVAECYLGSGHGALFQDTASLMCAEDTVDYPGLHAASALEIALLLNRLLHSWPARKLYARHLIGDWLRQNIMPVYLFFLPSYRRWIGK
jgi:hypothetical protein